MAGKQAKVITPPMLKRMLRHVSRSSSFPERDRAMILLSVKAGLRACEIAGLDWPMVLDARGRVSDTIHVRDLIAKNAAAAGFLCIPICGASCSGWPAPPSRSGQ
jgi:integrase/recombinase XerD